MERSTNLLRRLRYALGPAIPFGTPQEATRAGAGAAVGLLTVGLITLSPLVDRQLGLYLIAPFGASSVLLFAAPNSPLAQPWSAIVGNTVAALIGVMICLAVPSMILAAALAVGLTIGAMILLRAVHPPAGAVAMTAVLSPEKIQEMGYAFAMTPVAFGTVLLVGVAVFYNRLSGRLYPSLTFPPTSPYGDKELVPIVQSGLTQDELGEILAHYEQSLNLGANDLARLIHAAEIQVASHRTGPLAAEHMMSRDLVTISPETPLAEVANLFRIHGFTSLPVVDEDKKFLGIIFQIHLIRRARNDALRLNRGFAYAMRRLVDSARTSPAKAQDIMEVAGPRAAAGTPVAVLLSLMADSKCEAIPVLSYDRIVGIVTQTDLISALVRETSRIADR